MSMQLHHTLMSQYKHGTASGTGSVSYDSVANCVTPEVVIYGKCIQDGTPTPDVPVDIVCNNNIYECHGKNLIPFPYAENNVTRRGISYTVNSDGGIHAKGTVAGSSFFRIATLYLGDKAINAMNKESATNGVYTASKQLYYNATSNVLSLNFADGTIVDEVFYPQVEYGTVATPYEPYFNGGTVTAPKLYAVGDVRDEYYPLTGKIIRRCKKHILSSADDITTYGTITFIYKGENPKTEQNTSICSHSKNVMSSWEASFNGVYGVHSDNNITGYKYFRPPNDSIDSIDKFNAWLDEQKAAGTPVTLVYVLAEPVIEYVDPVQITSARGTNIIEETDLMSELFDIPFVTGTQIDVKYLTHS